MLFSFFIPFIIQQPLSDATVQMAASWMWQHFSVTVFTHYSQLSDLFVSYNDMSSRMCSSHCCVHSTQCCLKTKRCYLTSLPFLQPYVWTGPSISTCSPPMETATERPSMCIWTYVMMMTSEASLETLLEGQRCEDEEETRGGNTRRTMMTN